MYFRISMFNLISLFCLLKTEDSAKEFLQQKGILKTETVCPKCKIPLRTEVRRKNFRFFKCSKCSIEETIRKGSFLYNKGLKLVTFVLTLYMFCNLNQMTLAQVVHEVNTFCIYEIGVANVIFRFVCFLSM